MTNPVQSGDLGALRATRFVPTCAVVLLAALLAACQPTDSGVTPVTDAPSADGSTKSLLPAEVSKFCDHGRAVYVFDGYKQGGIAVVENAAECRATTAYAVGTEAEGRSALKATGETQ